MQSKPPARASLLIAAYNEERRIGDTLRSLEAQTWPDFEILVVDDGSTDSTRSVAAGFKSVRLLEQAHLGKAQAMNLAGREAGGEILFFMDADIEYAPDYVASMIAPILDGKEIGTAHGTERVANPGNPWAACWQIRAGLPVDVRVDASSKTHPEGSPVFRAIRRDLFLKVNGFDDTGFMDDQTLAPKIGRNAAFVAEASCRHHNPDTLAEVYATGRWNAKSLVHRHGSSVLVRYFPLFAPFRALKAGWQHRSATMFVYVLVLSLGVAAGAWRFRLGLERHLGK
jgi:glycosyltransferase involved in cell wall biosynthesis